MMQSLFCNGEKGFVFDFSTVTGNTGDPVSLVSDLSGNGNNITQAVLAKKPKVADFGSKRGVSFDGVDDSLFCPSVDLAGASVFTLLVAARYYGSSLGVLLEYGPSPYTGAGGFGAYFNNGGQALGSGFGNSQQAFSFLNCPSSSEGKPSVMAVTFKPAGGSLVDRQKLRLNGCGVAEVNASSVGNPTAAMFSASSLYLGGRTGSAYFARCEVFGVIGIARELTAQEMASAEAWLSQMLPPAMDKPRRHFDVVGSLIRVDHPTHIETDSFAYAEFTTQASAIEVESYSTMADLFPTLAEIGITVDGTFFQHIRHASNGSLKTTVYLPDGWKTVRIMAGPQARANGTVGQPWRGTWFKSFVADAPLMTKPSGDCLFVQADSIGAGAWADDVHANAWIAKTRAALGIRLVAKAIGSQTLYDDCSTIEAARDFADQIARVAPTMIWEAIGTNDFGLARWSAADFGKAYANLLDAIAELMPWVKVFAQTPLERPEPGVQAFRDAIATACANRSNVVLIDGPSIMPISRMPDNLHPDTEGHDMYAAFATSTIKCQ